MRSGSTGAGLLAVLDQHAPDIMRYLLAHGAGDSAEDLLQELRVRLLAGPAGPVQSPLGYLYRAATNLMIDHRRARAQAEQRDRQWAEVMDRSDGSIDPQPLAERRLDGQRLALLMQSRLGELPDRVRTVLLRHRLEGVSQRLLAAELGLSQSTIESDLRAAYRWLDQVRSELDEESAR